MIEDNGIGMKQEEVKKLFKPFSQANKKIQGSYGGTGLGLWITKKLIEHHNNGTVNVSSEKNIGTKFSIEMKL